LRPLTREAAVSSEPIKTQGAVRLGDDFEFEPQFRTLRRSGSVLKLQRIPLEALAVLIEQAGEIVTRDQLTEKIWGKGVFLDAENSLNIAIRKLRLALGDDPEHPHFIQTVTGQGYRLIAPAVEVAGVVEVRELADMEASSGRNREPAAANEGSRPHERAIAKSRLPQLWQALAAAAAVLLLMIGGWLFWTRMRNHPAPGKAKSMLAVLPLQNLTGDAGQDYFSDGLTEEMVTQLGNLDPQHLGVIAGTSMMSYKNHEQTVQRVGRDLGVQYVLEGSVRREHDEARISVRLVRSADGVTLWTESFDRHVGDVLSLESEIAQRIGGELQMQVLGRAPRKPASSEAVEAYLRGRFELNRGPISDAPRSYFERTIALDPSYAPAYAGLADFYRWRAVWKDDGSGQAWRLAGENAAKALSLDANSAEAHIAMAYIKLVQQWDWQGAREHAVRALQLNPSLPEAHSVYATYLRVAGNIPEDLNHRRQALAVDPYREDLKQQLIFEQFFARDYQSLLAPSREEVARVPDNADARLALCADLGRVKLFDEAVAECGKGLVSAGHAEWAAEYKREYEAHGYDAASLLLAKKQLEEMLKGPHQDLWELANAYAAAGMRDETLNILFRLLPGRDAGLLQVRVDPDFDLIRDDPRYAELIRQMNLPNE
jgi:TolB-like protein/DNA-binding winged helix-turn-helix (wHTH) protein